MITRNDIKWLKSLNLKKNRDASNKFLVEGEKLVEELLSSDLDIDQVYALEGWDLQQSAVRVKAKDLVQISSLKTPHNVVACAIKPKIKPLTFNGKTIVLDAVRDPGNLGTIIRTARWFGIERVVCSLDCADVYNPKVLRASMGAVFHVPVFYVSLEAFFDSYPHKTFGLDMEGNSVYQSKVQGDAAFVFGNEANGMSEHTKSKCHEMLSIPGTGHQESLNVALSAAICMSEIFRTK